MAAFHRDPRDTQELLVARPATRLAAVGLVLALPLAAAGCGAAKRRTIQQEFASAESNLKNASSVSVTVRFDDAKGNTRKAVTKDGDLSDAVAKELLGGSVTYSFGTAGGKKLQDLRIDPSASEAELQDEVKDVNLSLAVKDSQATVAEIRLVDSTLYARVDVDEIDRVATAAGEDGFEASFDDFVQSAPANVRPALEDAKAGKWLTLPLKEYLGKVKDLTGALPTPSAGADTKKLQADLVAAVKPYVKVTDAGGGSDQRVLDVDIAARPAAKAVLTLLKAQRGLPFADLLEGASPTDVDDALADGTAHGTITLSDGHLTQVTLDIESIRQLDPDAGTTSLAGSSLVIDVDDDADEVEAPGSDVSDVDVKAAVEDLFDSFFGGFTGSSTGSSTMGFSYSG